MHEAPWLEDGDATVLAAGMVVSNEPGIYIPGQWGARIEDIVLVASDKVEPINTTPHELVRVG